MRRGERGFTLVEVTVALAIGGMLLSGVAGALWQFQRTPDRSAARLFIHDGMRTATTWVRLDANKAQNFQAGTSPTYGTFRWLDFSTFPVTRRKVVYFWEEGDVPNPSATSAPFNYGILYRQPYTDGEAEPKIPLIRHIAASTDITFTVSEAVHEENQFSTKRTLAVSMTATTETGATGQIQESSTLTVELRPEQLQPQEYVYYFLHNSPTPPTGNTNSQVTLPTDTTQSTATTLYNYDVNRDAVAGLLLVLSSPGGKLDTPDTTKKQDWLSDAFSSDTVIDGRVTLFISAAASAFATDKLLTLHAWLRDYDPSTASYTLIANQVTISFTSTASWSAVSIHFRPTVYTLAQGHKLALQVQFDGLSEANGMVAYDTTSQLAFLSVPTQP